MLYVKYKGMQYKELDLQINVIEGYSVITDGIFWLHVHDYQLSPWLPTVTHIHCHVFFKNKMMLNLPA